jgi:hypothetical protein
MREAVAVGRNCYHAQLWKGMDMQGKWGASPTVDSCRAQWVLNANIQHNTSHYYRFGLMLPESWEQAGMCLLHDYHGVARAGQSMSVYANGPSLEWWIVNENPVQRDKNYTRAKYTRPLELGTWQDIEAKVHYDTDHTAFTVVSVNGQPWFDDRKPNAFPTDAANGARMVVGPYVWDLSTVQNKRRECYFTIPTSTVIV